MNRYRTANLLPVDIMLGSNEADTEQVRRFLWITIDELRLWSEIVVTCTPKFSKCHQVQVAVVAVAWDEPAAHKLGDSGSPLSHLLHEVLDWKRSESVGAALH